MHPATAPIEPELLASIKLTDTYVAKAGLATSALPQIVVKMIELFDGTNTVVQVCEQMQISVATGLAIVRKLLAKGILESAPRVCRLSSRAKPAEPAEPAELSSGFSTAEEAFFATEVRPIDECDEPFVPSLGQRLGLWLSELCCRLTRAHSF